MRLAMDYWEEHTCLRFEQTSNFSQPFIDVWLTYPGCYTEVGRWYFEFSQDLDLGWCDTVSTVYLRCPVFLTKWNISSNEQYILKRTVFSLV